jgi:hypothetical protein
LWQIFTILQTILKKRIFCYEFPGLKKLPKLITIACYRKKQYPHMGFALHSHYLSERQQEVFPEHFIHALMTRHVFCNYGCMKLFQGD